MPFPVPGPSYSRCCSWPYSSRRVVAGNAEQFAPAVGGAEEAQSPGCCSQSPLAFPCRALFTYEGNSNDIRVAGTGGEYEPKQQYHSEVTKGEV